MFSSRDVKCVYQHDEPPRIYRTYIILFCELFTAICRGSSLTARAILPYIYAMNDPPPQPTLWWWWWRRTICYRARVNFTPQSHMYRFSYICMWGKCYFLMKPHSNEKKCQRVRYIAIRCTYIHMMDIYNYIFFIFHICLHIWTRVVCVP